MKPAIGPTPRETPDRCAARAEADGHAMLGSAFAEPGVLLVELPGPWGPGGLTESRLDPRVAAALEMNARQAGLRAIAIRRPGPTVAASTRRWMIGDCRPETRSLRWGTYDNDEDLLELQLDGPGGDSEDAPVYLVCTHGGRDACCAIRGRPTVAALAALRPADVWECSHLGGHRFSANVLALPSGVLYGRVRPADAPALIAATDSGNVLLPFVRGHIGVTPPEQVALAAVLEAGMGCHPDRLRILAAHSGADGDVTVRVDSGTGAVDVVIRASRGETDLPSCGTHQPSPFLTYAAVSLSGAGHPRVT